MSELIADLPYRITDVNGDEFYVTVAGEPRLDGRWDGWLEYVPLGESEPLLTHPETTQSSRTALVRWTETLTETYVEGAFERAVRATPQGTTRATVARRFPRVDPPSPVADLPDPFELLMTGDTMMRARLAALPRPILLDIIAEFGLNPAGKTLSWLSHRQLVTFIVTAADMQARTGRRAT